MFEAMNLAIFIGSALVIASVFTSLISFRFGAPLLLIFLTVGLLAGEDGPLGIEFDNGRAAFFVGSVALAIILFDSGFATRSCDASASPPGRRASSRRSACSSRRGWSRSPRGASSACPGCTA